MAQISRIRCAWTGFNGGPGVSTFYCSGTDYAAIAPLNTFWQNMITYLPTGVTVTVPGEGDVIDDATGALVGQWAHGTDTAHVGTGTGPYVPSAGALIQWKTSTIHNRRRLQGHTFLVPITTAWYSSTGLLTSGFQSALQTAVNTLLSTSSNELVVWGRPKAGAGGLSGQITNGNVPTKTTVLRSRRD